MGLKSWNETAFERVTEEECFNPLPSEDVGQHIPKLLLLNDYVRELFRMGT